MNAYLSDRPSTPFSPPPVLIAGSSDDALARAQRTVEAAGLRIADAVSIDAAAERIAAQVSASALWLELDRDEGPRLDAALAAAAHELRGGRCPVVVAGSAEMIDALFAQAPAGSDLVIGDDEGERAAALALAVARPSRGLHLSDVASDQEAARLRQLSDEVSRIAATLARLSAAPGPAPQPLPTDAGESPEVSAELVRDIIRARRLRSRYFPEDLFADPAWDMLLDLLQAEIAQLRVPVSSLCIAAAVPATTALRWLKTMTDQGLFVRRADPHDGRRVFVELAPAASKALRRYFAEVGKPAVV